MSSRTRPGADAVDAPLSASHRLVLDDGTVADEQLLVGYDPEAGKRAAAAKRLKIKKQLASAGSQLVIGLVIGIVSLALVILGATNWPRLEYVIPAGVCAPIGFWYCVVRWRRWLGQAPYCYRLLTSLGEDADNILAGHRQSTLKKAHKKMAKLERKLGS